METLFNEIQKRIADNTPALSLIDEDYGQLDFAEDQYPVTFPCVLISAPQVAWNNFMDRTQKGSATITTRLAIDCYADTHYGSTQENQAATRMKIASDLNKLLQCYKFESAQGPMVRISSRSYSLQGGIKVYEATYQVNVVD